MMISNLISIHSSLILFIITTIILYFNPTYCEDNFKPITEDVSFKAIYRVKTFIDGNPESMYEVYEKYQHNLAAANIWLKQFNDHDENLKAKKYKFLYNGETRKDISIKISEDDDDVDVPNEIYLYENGGSSAYGDGKLFKKSQPKVVEYTDENHLDSILFNARVSRIDLDMYMTSTCREKILSKLHYIRGFSRLLHLIECRRREFVKDTALTDFTRGYRKVVYVTKKLPIFKGETNNNNNNNDNQIPIANFLNMSVSIQHRMDADKEDDCLPSRSIPLSITISFEPKVSIIINCYQFEFIDIGEHLSESFKSVSDFTLPLRQGIINRLSLGDLSINSASISAPRMSSLTKFSFEATLTGSNLPFEDPIELLVVYNGKTKTLARQLSLVDRTESLGDSYKRHTTRLVFDGETGFKFHIMHSNSDYHINLESKINSFFKNTSSLPQMMRWHSCVSNSLTNFESQVLETGGSEMFDLDNAFFMGTAIVRGIPCYVYEKRLYRLPAWMGLGSTEYSFIDSMARSQIIVTLYESIREFNSGDFEVEQLSRNHDEQQSKLVRLNVDIISTKDQKINLSYRFEINSFDWSINLAHDQMELFDIGQECLFNNPHSRHVEMNLQMKPISHSSIRTPVREFYHLGVDDKLRWEVVSQALSKSLDISQSQQADLETILHQNFLANSKGKYRVDNDKNNEVILEAKLSVYELPTFKITSTTVGYAKDLSVGYASTGSWSIGATSISLEECQWRAAHTLNFAPLSSSTAAYNAKNQEDGFKLFMYCPKTLHCVLGDKTWEQMYSRSPLLIDSVLQFPYPATTNDSNIEDDNDKCMIMLIFIARQRVKSRSIDTGGRTLLEWMIFNKHERLIETPIDLDVNNSIIPMSISKVRLSKIIGGGDDEALTSWPLRGISYDIKGQQQVIEPLVVSSLAQCSHACLMLHNCNSYSICHSKTKFDCLLTTVNWTNSSKINEAIKFSQPSIAVAVNGSSSTIQSLEQVKKKPGLIEFQLEDGDQSTITQVQLRKSNLCSLHKKNTLDLFSLEENNLMLIPNINYLLHVDTAEECARFCMSRANFLESINIKSQSQSQSQSQSSSQFNGGTQKFLVPGQGEPSMEDRERTCTSFKFSQESKFCELLPQIYLTKILDYKLDNSESNKQIIGFKRWQNSIAKMRARMGSMWNFAETDRYELIYEQVFISYFGKRLIVNSNFGNSFREDQQTTFVEGEENNNNNNINIDDASRFQVTRDNTNAHECAKLCLGWLGCRSFDILVAAEQSASLLPAPPVDGVGNNKSTTTTTTTNSINLSNRLSDTCILNGLSLFDLSRLVLVKGGGGGGNVFDRKAPLSLEQQTHEELKEDQERGRWFHYEPSELALYLMSDNSESGAWGVSSATSKSKGNAEKTTLDSSRVAFEEQNGIFIRPAIGVSMTPKQITAYLVQVDAQRGENDSTKSHKGNEYTHVATTTGNRLIVLLMVTAAILLIIVIFIIYVLIANRRRIGASNSSRYNHQLLPFSSISCCQCCFGGSLTHWFGSFRERFHFYGSPTTIRASE